MVWPSLRYHDAPAAIEFLTTIFGFELVVSYSNTDDQSIIEHAQLRWPEGGGLMLGSQRESAAWPATAGHGATHVVTDRVAEVYERVRQAGFRLLQELKDDDYYEDSDTQTFSTVDPEGNIWSFGSYRGEPAK
jgi:uncharacterized glyoxalase superfamily protein PhnB